LPNSQALVLIASPPLTNPIDQSVFNPHPAAGLFFKEDLTESDIDVIVSSLVYPGEDMAAELKDELRRADPLSRKYIYQAIATGNMKNEVAVAEKAIIPIALIQGTSDQLINSDYYARLNIPKLWKGQVQYIEKAGHTPQLEQPQAINNLLYNLIKDIRY
ncbi:MAG: alpha/beta fold hydrolase, partial [Bacteroidota bacterium]